METGFIALPEGKLVETMVPEFTMAAEGMNIKDLNTVALVTPKSRIEQAVGRIFRLKKEERVFHPIIYDIIDTPHDVCIRQYKKRAEFYKQCGYQIYMKEPGGSYKKTKGRRAAEEDEGKEEVPAGKPLFKS